LLLLRRRRRVKAAEGQELWRRQVGPTLQWLQSCRAIAGP